MIPNFFRPPVQSPLFGPRPGMMGRIGSQGRGTPMPPPNQFQGGGMPQAPPVPIGPGPSEMLPNPNPPQLTPPNPGLPPGGINDRVNLGPPGSPIPTGMHGPQLAGEPNPAMQPGNIGAIASGQPSNLGGDIVNLGPPGFNQGTNHGPQSAGPTSPSLQDLRAALTRLHVSQATNRMGRHNAAHGAAWGQ